MDTAAKVTSKGQITVPKAVREALDIKEGDEIIFRVEGLHVTMARTANFLDLANTVSVPAAKRNAAWNDILRTTRGARAAKNR